jgi:hypothetical protein
MGLLAMDPQPTCHLLAVLGRLGDPPVEPRHTGLPMAVMCTWQALLEGGFIRTKRRSGMAHGWPFGRARLTRPQRRTDLCHRLNQNSYHTQTVTCKGEYEAVWHV